MRSPRRFRPALDCLHARIAPSAVAAVAPVPMAAGGSGPVMTAMDETGSPGSNLSGYGSYQYLMTPPGAGSPSTGNLC
jgi:hypothetical protein